MFYEFVRRSISLLLFIFGQSFKHLKDTTHKFKRFFITTKIQMQLIIEQQANHISFEKLKKMGMMGKESPSLKKLVLHSKEDKRWSCEKLFISIFICLKLVRPAFLNQAPPYMYALNEDSMTHSCKLRSLKMKVHASDSFFSWYCLGPRGSGG